MQATLESTALGCQWAASCCSWVRQQLPLSYCLEQALNKSAWLLADPTAGSSSSTPLPFSHALTLAALLVLSAAEYFTILPPQTKRERPRQQLAAIGLQE